jgi:hypothetical protein
VIISCIDNYDNNWIYLPHEDIDGNMNVLRQQKEMIEATMVALKSKKPEMITKTKIGEY